jgi:diaminopimelate decarboxylase
MTSSITPLCISPGVTPDTRPGIATGHSRSKFGLPAGATATGRLIERMLARGSVRLICEPGRWIVAPAAVTLYIVGTVRHSPDGATIAAVDGGMTDNMREALHGAEDEVLVPGRPHEQARPVAVVGKHCESGDILRAGVMLPENLAPRGRRVQPGHWRLRVLQGQLIQPPGPPGRRVRLRRPRHYRASP